MDLGLEGRVAVVTGASRGLGLAVAKALAGEGVSIVANSRQGDSLADAVALLESSGANAVACAGDVVDDGLPDHLVATALEHFGRLDILVTNSGGPPPGRALELDDESIHAAVESNLLAHVRLVRAALPVLKARGWGRIAAIASYGVVQPIPNLALSNLARTGLRAWAKSAAYDLQGSGVTLNVLAPGLHLTDRIRSLGERTEGIGDPDDFGRLAAFVCSEHARYLSGATIVVDGGETLAL